MARYVLDWMPVRAEGLYCYKPILKEDAEKWLAQSLPEAMIADDLVCKNVNRLARSPGFKPETVNPHGPECAKCMLHVGDEALVVRRYPNLPVVDTGRPSGRPTARSELSWHYEFGVLTMEKRRGGTATTVATTLRRSKAL